MRTALIVGAGIGGLAAGVALRRAGWRVRIYERAANPRELGFALLLAPNAIASLRVLGLADAVIANGAVPHHAELRGTGAQVFRRFDTSVARRLLPEPPVVVLRPVLHGALLDSVGRDSLVLDSAVTSFTIENGQPVLRIDSGDAISGDVLIGADGVGSVVRRTLHPDEPPPRRSGLFGIRGVAHGVAAQLAGVTGAQYFGRGVEAGVSMASSSAVYWYLSVRAADIAGERDPLAVARRLAAPFDDRLRSIVDSTRPDDARCDELLDREPLDGWGRGPVTLLGDAAHPMLPHAGQGAAQALEDAVALGRVLDGAAGVEQADVEQALRRYERVRARRTREVVLTARRNARMAAVHGAAATWLRNRLIAWMPESVLLKAYVAFGTPPDPLE
jgi:2-polyprenyl-6-methoxyphenol hydroxylase-like FAD-dependent oxidoreductase